MLAGTKNTARDSGIFNKPKLSYFELTGAEPCNTNPFFFRVRIVLAATVRVTFLPFTTKVFFCRFGRKTRLVRRMEKLTLLPNCLPLPVMSHRDAMLCNSFFFENSETLYMFYLFWSSAD